jgi:outer membrane biosynthesis protein TonB
MTNLNDRDVNPSPVNRVPNNLPVDKNVPGVTGTNETNMHQGSTPSQVSYGDGYAHGRVVENIRQEEVQEVRDNDNAARGLLLGIILTGLTGLTIAAVYLLNQRSQVPPPATPPVVIPQASPSPSQPPQVRERVIERQVPAPQAPAPNVNITVPSPAPQQAPVSQPAPANPPASQSAPAAQPSPATTPSENSPSDTRSQTTTDGAAPSPAAPNAAPGSNPASGATGN